MNVCGKNRKALAWLAVGALDPREAETLREHVASCAGCRHYLREIEHVSDNLRAAEAPAAPAVEDAPYVLRPRVRRKVREARPSLPFPWLRALPAMAVIVLLCVIVSRHPAAPPPSQPPAKPAVARAPFIAPTLLNYQIAVNQSPAALDHLLQQQGDQSVTPAPIYRAGSLTASGLSE